MKNVKSKKKERQASKINPNHIFVSIIYKSDITSNQAKIDLIAREASATAATYNRLYDISETQALTSEQKASIATSLGMLECAIDAQLESLNVLIGKSQNVKKSKKPKKNTRKTIKRK